MAAEKSKEPGKLPGVDIPEKMFYKIRDVAKIVGVKPHVLRYWESEFPGLHPKKNRNGQRIYTRKDIDMALQIRSLLHLERFSIAGARQRLKKKKKPDARDELIANTRQNLVELLEILESDV